MGRIVYAEEQSDEAGYGAVVARTVRDGEAAGSNPATPTHDKSSLYQTTRS